MYSIAKSFFILILSFWQRPQRNFIFVCNNFVGNRISWFDYILHLNRWRTLNVLCWKFAGGPRHLSTIVKQQFICAVFPMMRQDWWCWICKWRNCMFQVLLRRKLDPGLLIRMRWEERERERGGGLSVVEKNVSPKILI